MEGMEYLYELFERLPRCGPGENEFTRRALNAIPKLPNHPFILDIGCGSGAQTLELAKISNAKIVALDNHQAFLDRLMQKAEQEGVADRIIPQNMSMLAMGFKETSFDIIWSEGALYFMGFQNGLRRCHQLLKKGGYLAVTEAVFLMAKLPDPVLRYWQDEYPDMKDVHGNIELIQNQGFRLLSNFTLPKSAWLDRFYLPMEKELLRLNEKYRSNEIACRVFENLKKEINIYKQYSDYFGYEFFVMQKVNSPEIK